MFLRSFGIHFYLLIIVTIMKRQILKHIMPDFLISGSELGKTVFLYL